MRSHRLFALPEISTPSAALVETCACASSFSVHHQVYLHYPEQYQHCWPWVMGFPITAEREQTNIGERVLNCPSCLMKC